MRHKARARPPLDKSGSRPLFISNPLCCALLAELQPNFHAALVSRKSRAPTSDETLLQDDLPHQLGM